MSEYVSYVKRLDNTLTSNLKAFDIELTERCNNRCIHCYINQPEDDQLLKSREMDTAFIKDILNQAADLGYLTVRYTGGEPLLREDFVELYLHARRLGLKVLIFTNARLITYELADLFASVPPGKLIEISVYGMHASTYDSVVAMPGAFDQFWNGIALLQEFQVPFVVKQSILPQNRSELAEFEAFAAALPHMNRLDKNLSYNMNFDLRARRDDERKNNLIRCLRVSPQDTLAILTREPEKYLKSMQQFVGRFMNPPGDVLFDCGSDHGVCIDAYGNAQMCMLLRHPDTVYPLSPELHRERNPKTDLKPLEFALMEFFPQIRRIVAANQGYLRRCAICFLKGLCEQCPAKSWEEHGTLDTPVEYLCEVAHAQAAYLGLILKGEQAWKLAPETWQTRIKAFMI